MDDRDETKQEAAKRIRRALGVAEDMFASGRTSQQVYTAAVRAMWSEAAGLGIAKEVKALMCREDDEEAEARALRGVRKRELSGVDADEELAR